MFMSSALCDPCRGLYVLTSQSANAELGEMQRRCNEAEHQAELQRKRCYELQHRCNEAELVVMQNIQARTEAHADVAPPLGSNRWLYLI